MSIILPRVAGVKRIIACSPPDISFGTINPATLVAMDIAELMRLLYGWSSRIGALAFGTKVFHQLIL